MKYKTLLLGTAAVFAVAGSARAADLAVAESVEYVKVCDAYGKGYFYIPGSDTCIQIGGDVQADAVYNTLKAESGGNIVDKTGEDETNWFFDFQADAIITTKSMTDWGMVTTYVDIRATGSKGVANPSPGNTFYAHDAYAKIGGLKVGWDASTFDSGFLGVIDSPTDFDHDQHQLQFQWSTTMGGWGFFLAVEDPSSNSSGIHGSPAFTASGDTDVQPGIPGAQDNEWTYKYPDIVAAITGGGGPFHWKGSVGVTDTAVGTGWGAALWAQYLQNGNSITLQGAVSNGAGALYGANIQPNGYGAGTYWHVAAQAGWAVTSALTLLAEAGYASTPMAGVNAWEAAGEADWTVAKNTTMDFEVYYLSKNLAGNVNKSSTNFDFRVTRSFD